MNENAQARYEAAAARQNANLELAARGDAVERGQFEQRRHWRNVAQAYGGQVVAQAASGLDVGFGSPADLTGDIMMIGGEDARTIDQNVVKEVQGYEINAANYIMRERAAKSRGRSALIGSVLGATGTILGGATKLSQFASPSMRGG